MGKLTAVPHIELKNVLKKPIKVLDLEQFNQIAKWVKNGVPEGDLPHVKVIGVGFFITKGRKKELIIDFQDEHGGFVGRNGGGGDPPIFPIK